MKFEIYSKPSCGYCVRAKALLESRSEEFTVIDIAEGSIEDQVLAREKLIDRVVNATGNAPKTMPQIFVDNVYVGGYDQLAAMLEERDFIDTDKTD